MTRHRKSLAPMMRNRAWRPAVQRLNESLTRNKRNSAESALALKGQLTRIRFKLFGCLPQ
jgi:hypothetical protein